MTTQTSESALTANPAPKWPARRVAFGLLAAWLIALPLDRAIAIAFHTSGIDAHIKGRWFAELLKAPGFFGFAGPALILLALIGALRWREAGVTLLAMALSGGNVLLKWAVGRMRPFRFPGPGEPHAYTLQPFWHGIYGLFHEKDLSFPSGHACMAAAMVASLIPIRPHWTWPLLVMLLCTGIERAAENAHYASDVIAAYAVGALAAWVARRLCSNFIPGPIA